MRIKSVFSAIFLLISSAAPAFADIARDISCLAKNIYFEARNQSHDGQKAVAFVTLNRVKSTQYPNDICEVVWQYRQFSWTVDDRVDQPRDIRSFKIATVMALYVYTKYGTIPDPTKGAIMYHANYVDPYWRHDYKLSTIIGDHIFYVDY